MQFGTRYAILMIRSSRLPAGQYNAWKRFLEAGIQCAGLIKATGKSAGQVIEKGLHCRGSRAQRGRHNPARRLQATLHR